MSLNSRISLICAATIVALAPVEMASATDGYFAHGFGARHKALGGSGVADGNDATTAALNPAGLVHLKRSEFSASVTAFSPHRKYDQTGFTRTAPFAGPGTVESDENLFAIPNMAYARRLEGFALFDVFGMTVYGNGGMNTSYAPTSAGGVFGTPFRTGVNLEQAFLSVAVAKRLGSFSVGIAPIIARQQFRAQGLQSFGVADRGHDVSWGYGVRAGVELELAPGVRAGVAGNSRIYMTRFDRYANLFAENGDFDIPPSLQAGIAIDFGSNLTVTADYKRIWYSEVAAVGNPSTLILGGNPLGGANGPGFGWQDIDIFKFGLEWQASEMLTLRAGYSYNTQPIKSRDVTFNILAPGVVQHHITAGAELRLDNNWSLELAGMYAPETSVTGNHLFNGADPCFPGGPACDGTETISMYQYEVTAGIKYKF